eukprot:1544064-Prymnesium_polylepis.2
MQLVQSVALINVQGERPFQAAVTPMLSTRTTAAFSAGSAPGSSPGPGGKGSARFVTRASPSQVRAPQARHKGRAPRFPSVQIKAPRLTLLSQRPGPKETSCSAHRAARSMQRDHGPPTTRGNIRPGASADTALEGTPQKGRAANNCNIS